jgi:phage gpG-like protein
LALPARTREEARRIAQWCTVRNVGLDIPARPFLGVSDADEQMIENTVTEYLRRALK